MSYNDENYAAGRLVSRADSAAGTFTTFNPDGSVASSRALTAAEVAGFAARAAADQVTANAATLTQRANAALTANAAFLAVGAPTNAQVLAQVQTLTKECSALVRLALGLLDSTAGT